LKKPKLSEVEELLRTIRQKLQCLLAENGKRQKIINIREIDSAIEEGYEYVDKLPDVRIVDLTDGLF
jgi:hypothetical protein